MKKFEFDVVTIGSATRDAVFKSDAFKIITNPEFVTGKALAMDLGGKIRIDDIFFSTGGAGTNAAVAFARQNLKTAAVFRIGKDVSGEAIKEEMAKEKVNADFIQEDEKLPTAYSVILEHKEGERTILVFRGANENVDEKEIPWTRITTKCFYLSSLSANLNILQKAIDYKKSAGALIAWNPGGSDLQLGLKTLLYYLKNMDIFLINQEEASALLNIPYEKTGSIFKKFNEIIQGLAVMTKGPKGVLVSDGKNIFEAGVFQENKIVDRTGAGDAFGSGFVAGLLNSKNFRRPSSEISEENIKYAIKLASANATSKVENMGAKKGLLTKKGFEKSSRFKNLTIKITPLKNDR